MLLKIPTKKVKLSKTLKKSYRLSRTSIDLLEKLAVRLSGEAGVTVSMAKVIEIAIFHIKNKNIHTLLKLK